MGISSHHLSLSDLAGNLYNISVVASDNLTPEQVEQHLVPSLWGNRLYSRGIGKLTLQILYAALRLIRIDIRKTRFESVIRVTHQAFQDQAELLRQSINPNTYNAHKITDWNNWIYPVLNHRIWPNVTKVDAIFKRIVQDPNQAPTLDIWLKADQQVLKAHRMQKIIDIENKTSLPFPKETLIALMNKEQPSESSEKKLTEWIEVLKKRKTRRLLQKTFHRGTVVSVRKFHRALRVFVDDTPTPANRGGDRLPYLESELYARGLALFNQVDPKHVAWRSSLLTSKKITYLDGPEQKELALGDPLGTQRDPQIDQHLVFPLTTDPIHLVVVGKNEAILGIEEQRLSQSAYTAPKHAEIDLLDRDGRFKVIEKLEKTLTQHRWTSEDDVTAADEPIIQLIVQILKTMYTENYTLPLTPDLLFFNAAGHELKTIKELRKEDPFNFNQVIDFLMALNNKQVYRAVMESKITPIISLLDRKESLFYSAVVENALSVEGRKSLEEIAGSPRFGGNNGHLQGLVQRGRELEDGIQGSLATCVTTLVNEYDVEPLRTELQNAIRKNIKEHYEDERGAGRLWPSFKDDIIKNLRPWLELNKVALKPDALDAKIKQWIDSHKPGSTPSKGNDSLKHAGIYNLKQQEEAKKRLREGAQAL